MINFDNPTEYDLELMDCEREDHLRDEAEDEELNNLRELNRERSYDNHS